MSNVDMQRWEGKLCVPRDQTQTGMQSDQHVFLKWITTDPIS